MASNQPLTDEDRGPWLKKCGEAAIKILHDDTEVKCVLLSCSALKQRYRDVIRTLTEDEGLGVHFAYLKVEEKVLMERTLKRKGHYMKLEMVKGQLKDLEEPVGSSAETVDAGRELGEVVEEVVKLLRKRMDNHLERM